LPGGPARSDPDPIAADAESLWAAAIGHDLRNLLTAISLAVAMAADAIAEDHPARADLDEAQRATTRAAAMTDRLLEGVRPVPVGATSDDRVVPDGSRAIACDVALVIHSIEPILRRLVEPGIDLRIDVAADLGRVGLDEAAIECLVVNLVVNARDAQPRGGRIDVEATARPMPGSGSPAVQLTVADRGRGIAAEVRDRMFDPRVTTKPGGSGLGLAIVADVVRSVGGTVDAVDRRDGGTRFLVVLPSDGPRPLQAPARPRVHQAAPTGQRTSARRAAGASLSPLRRAGNARLSPCSIEGEP
jgi:signal transduction histidine kinase